MALLTAWQQMQALNGPGGLDATTIARLAQRAENDFVGCRLPARCGVDGEPDRDAGTVGEHRGRDEVLHADRRELSANPVAHDAPARAQALIIAGKVFSGDKRIDKIKSQVEFLEEAFANLADLVKEGKVRHIGLSNETPWGVGEFVKLADVVLMHEGWTDSHGACLEHDLALKLSALGFPPPVVWQEMGYDPAQILAAVGF